MSIHPSLRGTAKGVQQRSVLKRIERIKDLMAKGTWEEDRSVLGLPKTKIIKVRMKKEKAEKAETAEVAAPTAEAQAPGKAATTAAKAATPTKATSAKAATPEKESKKESK